MSIGLYLFAPRSKRIDSDVNIEIVNNFFVFVFDVGSANSRRELANELL